MLHPSPLPVVPRPLPDEHLTGWLGRVAGVYGLTAPALLDQLCAAAGQQRVPFETLCHHPPPETLGVLSGALGLPARTLADLTVPRLRPLWGATFRTSWTRSLPTLHCPACLIEDEAAGRPHHLRVDWTCALAFHCPVHHSELEPACPACRRQELIFHGPPPTARLHCAHCRSQLGGRAPDAFDRDHHPGRWPAANRKQGPDPRAKQEETFRAFLDTTMRALAWKPVDGPLLGSACPATVRSTLVTLLETLALPVRADGDGGPRMMLAQGIRLPWMRMALPDWLGPDTLVPRFGMLPAPARFDLLVALYAMLTGAEGLISFRQWRFRGEDWRVYCLDDPVAQLLCATDSETQAAILARSKLWTPQLAGRFSKAQDALQDKEDERQRAASRGQNGAPPVPITEGSPFDHHLFYRRYGALGDYGTLTVDEVLPALYRAPTDGSSPSRNATPAKAIEAAPPLRSEGERVGMDESAARPLASPPLPSLPPSTPPPEANKRPASILGSDLFMAAAQAAIAAQAASGGQRVDRRFQRQAWFRLVKEATVQLEMLKKHGLPTRSG